MGLREGLTSTEKEVLNALVEAWNRFLLLSVDHPNERREFLSAIHRAQALVAVRVARRLEPDFWRGGESADHGPA